MRAALETRCVDCGPPRHTWRRRSPDKLVFGPLPACQHLCLFTSPLSPNHEGRTLLHFAAGYGHEDVAALLCEADRELAGRADSNGDLPIHLAAVHGHAHAAFTCAQALAEGCLRRNTRGQAPVDIACACGHNEVRVRVLVQGCVNLSYRWVG